MENVITFRIEDTDKQKIKERAKQIGLDTASFCRTIILQSVKMEEAIQ
jgi:hypothetical protein